MYANTTWKAVKVGNTAVVNILFGIRDNDDVIEEIVCTR